VWDALAKGQSDPEPFEGCVAVLPIRKDGTEGRWQWKPSTLRTRLEKGRVRITGSEAKGFVVSILKDGGPVHLPQNPHYCIEIACFFGF
jgi:adenine-specific DNA-methyltransferase